MEVRCSVCEKDRPKRKVIKKMPLLENELPEKFVFNWLLRSLLA